jgi:hypothetical protein
MPAPYQKFISDSLIKSFISSTSSRNPGTWKLRRWVWRVWRIKIQRGNLYSQLYSSSIHEEKGGFCRVYIYAGRRKEGMFISGG